MSDLRKLENIYRFNVAIFGKKVPQEFVRPKSSDIDIKINTPFNCADRTSQIEELLKLLRLELENSIVFNHRQLCMVSKVKSLPKSTYSYLYRVHRLVCVLLDGDKLLARVLIDLVEPMMEKKRSSIFKKIPLKFEHLLLLNNNEQLFPVAPFDINNLNKPDRTNRFLTSLTEYRLNLQIEMKQFFVTVCSMSEFFSMNWFITNNFMFIDEQMRRDPSIYKSSIIKMYIMYLEKIIYRIGRMVNKGFTVENLHDDVYISNGVLKHRNCMTILHFDIADTIATIATRNNNPDGLHNTDFIYKTIPYMFRPHVLSKVNEIIMKCSECDHIVYCLTA
jgi:hypothetical protein